MARTLATVLALAAALACLAVPAPAASPARVDEERTLYERARQDYFRLAESPGLRGTYQNWTRLIDRFSGIYTANPQGDLAPQCLFWVGRLHGEAHERFKRPLDLAQGVDALQRLANHFPRSALADDAQFMIGQIYEKSGDLQRAYVEYLKVTVNFPKGDQMEPAKARLDALEAEIKRRRHQVPRRETAAPPGQDNANGLSPLTGLRHWSTPNYTRVVASLERPVAYKATLLSIENQQHQDQPRRLYLDLKGARLTPEAAAPLAIGDGLLRSARADQLAADTVRLALDINSLGSYKVFTLDNPFRVVVDCFAQPGAAAASPAPPPPPPPPPPAPATATAPAPERAERIEKADKAPAKKSEPPALTALPPAQAAKLRGHKVPRGQANQTPPELGLASQLGLRVRRVVLDPGHGGKDPGAIYRGLVEKDLTLDIAKRAVPKVARLLGAEVLLTRSKDVFMPLEERTAFANTHEADLFVSIHINAAPSSALSGIETYFLNLATDEDSMRVAARENATTKRSISDLQVILNDLMLNSKINESNRLARVLHKEMLEETRKGSSVQDLKVRQAPFYVLIGANMPAVLTEVGFITNPREAQRLADPAYRDKLAEGIAQGLLGYVRQLKIATSGR